MPRPFDGLVEVGQWPSRLEAELIARRLHQVGIDAIVIGDPAASIVPHHVTQRSFQVVCRLAEIEDARLALLVDSPMPSDEDLVERPRPRWVRVAAVIVGVAMLSPLVTLAVAAAQRILT